ncbi:MAG: FkbM family methyltransferase [Gemmatimonadota bacterium]|nr:FkbM family methyltransferase [Gemmatimonadota bacterium]
MSFPIRSVPVRIRNGPNAGRRWSLAASGRGVWSGRYERDRFEALESLLREDDVFWDVGAHRGYAALVAEGVVGSAGAVRAFEPSAENRRYLHQHLRWNRADRVAVHPAALADFDGTADFGGAGSSVSHRLGGGTEAVEVRTISSLVDDDGLAAPTFLKIDVEGAEGRVLAGARSLLTSLRAREARVPLALLSVHSARELRACLGFLRSFDYRVVGSTHLPVFMDLLDEPWYEDPDLLAVPRGGRVDLPAIRRMAWFRDGPDLTTPSRHPIEDQREEQP